MTLVEFPSDRPRKLSVLVDKDGLYLSSDCCGCGDSMTDVETVRALRDAITEWLNSR